MTKHQLEVCRLIKQGLSNKEIAEAMFVSVSAVKWHLQNIYRELNIHSRHQLVVLLAQM